MEIGPHLHQPSKDDLVPFDDSPMERCEPKIVLEIWIRPMFQQQVHGKGIALVCCPHQGSVTLLVTRVDVDGLMKKVEEWHDQRRMRDQVKGVVSLSVGEGWIGIMRNQQMDDIEVSISSGPLQWSRLEIATDGVDFCALFYEVTAGRQLGIDCGPMKRSAAGGLSAWVTSAERATHTF